MELCACHNEGIKILAKYLTDVIDLVEVFMKLPEDQALLTVKYPAATVLLDLTANETCIERVAYLIKDKNLFDTLLTDLDRSLSREVVKTSPDKL